MPNARDFELDEVRSLSPENSFSGEKETVTSGDNCNVMWKVDKDRHMIECGKYTECGKYNERDRHTVECEDGLMVLHPT